MNAGAGASRHVSAVVDEDGCAGLLGQWRNGVGDGQHGARRQIALAQLNQIHTRRERRAQEFNQPCRCRAAILARQHLPVGDQVDERRLAVEDRFHRFAIAVERCGWCA